MYAWHLDITCSILSLEAGGATDACVHSCVASLRHLLLPGTRIDSSGAPEVLRPREKAPQPLPIQHSPVSLTFALFSPRPGEAGRAGCPKRVLDPTGVEEYSADGPLTVCVDAHSEVCLLDFANGGGPGGLEVGDLVVTVREGVEAAKGAVEEMEVALKQAGSVEEPGPRAGEGPYSGDEVSAENEEEEEEERYRKMALSYAIGHVAAKITPKDSGAPPGGADGSEKKRKRKAGGLEAEMREFMSRGVGGGGSDDDDGDEEKEVTVVVSEFSDLKPLDPEPMDVAPVAPAAVQAGKTHEPRPMAKSNYDLDDSSDEDIDLKAAIKKKKKKKKKKGK